MSLLTIFGVIFVIGLVLWLVNNYIPMDAKIKKILNYATIIFLIVWLLKVAGAFAFLGSVHL